MRLRELSRTQIRKMIREIMKTAWKTDNDYCPLLSPFVLNFYIPEQEADRPESETIMRTAFEMLCIHMQNVEVTNFRLSIKYDEACKLRGHFMQITLYIFPDLRRNLAAFVGLIPCMLAYINQVAANLKDSNLWDIEQWRVTPSPDYIGYLDVFMCLKRADDHD